MKNVRNRFFCTATGHLGGDNTQNNMHTSAVIYTLGRKTLHLMGTKSFELK